MKCKKCDKDFHVCPACGDDDYRTRGYCSQNCFEESDDLKNELNYLQEVIKFYSCDDLKIIKNFLFNHYNSNLEYYYIKYIDKQIEIRNEEKMNIIQFKKLWNKIILNSCYYPTGNNNFYLYDKNVAEKITNEGRKKLNEINNVLQFNKI
jgi:hypothetical protein